MKEPLNKIEKDLKSIIYFSEEYSNDNYKFYLFQWNEIANYTLKIIKDYRNYEE
jgi:hypothetical protein